MFPQVDLYPSTHELCDSIANHLLYTIVIRQCSLMLRYLVHFYRHYCYFDYVPGKYGGTSVDWNLRDHKSGHHRNCFKKVHHRFMLSCVGVPVQLNKVMSPPLPLAKDTKVEWCHEHRRAVVLVKSCITVCRKNKTSSSDSSMLYASWCFSSYWPQEYIHFP